MVTLKKPISSTPIETHLQAILEKANAQTWTIRELFQALKGKGYPLLIILLSLPFCQPIQIPGFSTPFGILLIFVGLRMTFGRHIWWPQWVLNREISPRLLQTVVQKSLKFFQFLKPLIHERWNWLCTGSFLSYLHGVFVVLMGLYLALPLPIPFSNLLAAWALLLLGLGLIEEDGLFVCIAYGLGLLSLVVLGYLIVWLHAAIV
jgi:hypothetical protein